MLQAVLRVGWLACLGIFGVFCILCMAWRAENEYDCMMIVGKAQEWGCEGRWIAWGAAGNVSPRPTFVIGLLARWRSAGGARRCRAVIGRIVAVLVWREADAVSVNNDLCAG